MRRSRPTGLAGTLSTASEDVVECNWPRDFAANCLRASLAGTGQVVALQWVCICLSVGAGVVVGRQRARPTRWSQPKTFMIAAMASVLTSARTRTCGRSRAFGLSRMDANGLTGLLHK
jgi:hypothetical protein